MIKNSKTFPILITERLMLRQLSKSDSEEIFQLRSNSEINKYLDRKPSKTIEDALIFINTITANNNGDELFYWAITKKGEEKLIGTICLFDFLKIEKKCEIGYELSTIYQGQGLMIEAIQKVIQYAIETLGINIIEASTHKQNQSSIKLLKKLNFTQFDGDGIKNENLCLYRFTNTTK